MTETKPTLTDDRLDGRRDFDFLAGRWHIANQRLDDYLNPNSGAWLEFESTCESGPILGGLGNHDTYYAPDIPGRPEYHGFALRLFDPEARVWRIWWASTVAAGQLDTPVVGRFENGRGQFECADVFDGRPIKVRFDWTEITRSSARWEQSFSFDDGLSFAPNWIMLFERIS